MESPVNPWVRADLETFNPETLALHPEGLRPEYTRIMKELAHAKAIAALALERVYMFEQQREVHFAPFINTIAPEGASHDCVVEIKPVETDTPNYTPDETGYPDNVTDFAKYISERP